MIVELTPTTYFSAVSPDGVLSVVMHYGSTCGPCKGTMPHFEAVAAHFADYGIQKVKFFLFHHWENEYQTFINENNLQTKGVPTFKFFYAGEMIEEKTRSFNNADAIKATIISVVEAIDKTMGGFRLFDESLWVGTVAPSYTLTISKEENDGK